MIAHEICFGTDRTPCPCLMPGEVSGQGAVHLTHSAQWLLVTVIHGRLPYSRSTACTGQSPAHQPLFQSVSAPTTSATTPADTSRMNVAVPLTLNHGCRRGTITKSRMIPVKATHAWVRDPNRNPLVRKKRRAICDVVPSGQMFRHTPGANTTKAGAAGMSTSQIAWIPTRGQTRSDTSSSTPADHTTVATTIHLPMMRCLADSDWWGLA